MSVKFPSVAAKFVSIGALSVAACAFALPAVATTKGFNQIVTPDIQPEGVLSLGVQAQHPQIGNRLEVQSELGITRNFEVALFQGFSPNRQILGAELGLIQHGPYLLSTGFVNKYFQGGRAQPFIEGGYYTKRSKFVGGAIHVPGQTQALLGYAYTVNPKLTLSTDYQSGSGNSKTVGFTYNFTPNISFNPALYMTNDRPHHVYGYAVLTFNIEVFKSRHPKSTDSANQSGGSSANQ